MSTKTTIKPTTNKTSKRILTSRANVTNIPTPTTKPIEDTDIIKQAAVRTATTTTSLNLLNNPTVAIPKPNEELAINLKPLDENANLKFAKKSLRKTRRQRPYDKTTATQSATQTVAKDTAQTTTTRKQTPQQQQQEPLIPQKQQQQQRPRPLITTTTFATTTTATTSLTAAIAAALLQTTNATTATLTAALQTHAAATSSSSSAYEIAGLSSSSSSLFSASPAATTSHLSSSLSIDSSAALSPYPMAVLDGSLAQMEPNATTTHLLQHNAAISTATSALAAAAAAVATTVNSTLLLDDDGGGGGSGSDGDDWFDLAILGLKGFVMLFIIIAAIFGNLLVIISVMRVRKLR